MKIKTFEGLVVEQEKIIKQLERLAQSKKKIPPKILKLMLADIERKYKENRKLVSKDEKFTMRIKARDERAAAVKSKAEAREQAREERRQARLDIIAEAQKDFFVKKAELYDLQKRTLLDQLREQYSEAEKASAAAAPSEVKVPAETTANTHNAERADTVKPCDAKPIKKTKQAVSEPQEVQA